MKIKISAIAAAVAAATLSMAADAATIDFHGYARSGIGSSTKGGSMVCYNLGSANLGHFRLGNECDTYLELQFDSLLAEKAGSQFKFHTMLAEGTQQLQDWEEVSPALRQLWGEATNVGSGPLANASLWAGKRYYKRQDIHMLDMFYNEVAGPGAGIEGVDVGGIAKFSFALMTKSEVNWQRGTNSYAPEYANTGANAARNFDLRLEGLSIGDFGSADFIANIINQNNRADSKGVERNNDGGYALTAQHTIGVLGGFNRAVLQYAKDGAGLNGSARIQGWDYPGWTSTADYKGYRFLDHLVFDFGAINGSAVIGYQDEKSDAANLDNKTFTLGVRPWYHFNDLYSVGAELGHVQVKPKNGETAKLNKATLAAQIAPGKGFWTRPSLRAYYTYAKWNDAANKDNGWGAGTGGVACTGRDCGVTIDSTDIKGHTSGSTYGVQMEAWW